MIIHEPMSSSHALKALDYAKVSKTAYMADLYHHHRWEIDGNAPLGCACTSLGQKTGGASKAQDAIEGFQTQPPSAQMGRVASLVDPRLPL